MKFRRYFLAILFLMGIAGPISAQVNSDDLDFLQTIYGMEKREIFEEFIGQDVTKEFWSVYEEYDVKRIELGKKRFALLKEYAGDYLKMTDQKASNLLKSTQNLNENYNKLISGYTKKIEKMFGGNIAAQFYQLEHYFLSLTRTEIIENIPTIADMMSDN